MAPAQPRLNLKPGIRPEVPLLLGGMALGYKNYAKHYQVEVLVRNILDRIVTISDIDFDNIEGYSNDPRLIGVQSHVAF